MEEYKYSADDAEVQNFISHPLLDFTQFKEAQQELFDSEKTNIQAFIKRRSAKKIGFIMQNKVLNDVTIDEIKDGIKGSAGLDITLNQSNQIVVPPGVAEFDVFLKCLSDQIYTGKFTKQVYESTGRVKFTK